MKKSGLTSKHGDRHVLKNYSVRNCRLDISASFLSHKVDICQLSIRLSKNIKHFW
jgi:hypothetical protein